MQMGARSAKSKDGSWYYIALMILGLYAAVSLQKAVRDRDEGMHVTNLY